MFPICPRDFNLSIILKGKKYIYSTLEILTLSGTELGAKYPKNIFWAELPSLFIDDYWGDYRDAETSRNTTKKRQLWYIYYIFPLYYIPNFLNFSFTQLGIKWEIISVSWLNTIQNVKNKIGNEIEFIFQNANIAGKF